MKIPLYKVNTFTTHFSGGNPAGVCPLESWLPDTMMQAIAAENGFSETAFFVASERGWDLRWFTPTCEVDLCGHATLASAFVLRHAMGIDRLSYAFNTRSGRLMVEHVAPRFVLDMPAIALQITPIPAGLEKALGVTINEFYQGRYSLAVVDDENDVKQLAPNFELLRQVDCRCVTVTAGSKHQGIDFVSRFFAPKVGIPEDPVTGSAHCDLTLYWSEKLNKNQLVADQVSMRGGSLSCEKNDQRIKVGGEAVLYFQGIIAI